MINIKKNEELSVMTFYDIKDDDIHKYNFDFVWKNYILNKDINTVCRNIFEFNASVEVLTNIIINPLYISKDLLLAIGDEYDNGANYIFIQPINGVPVCGIYIDELYEILSNEILILH